MTKRLFFKLAVFTLASWLTACDSEQTEPQTAISLYVPDSIRQVNAITYPNLRLFVTVNDGPVQTVGIHLANDQPINIPISGVKRNLLNTIKIIWVEIGHAQDIEISEQIQTFLADGNTNIDAPHDFSKFDYDNDGTSNYAELVADTCVWSAQEICDSQSPPEDTSNTQAQSGNLISNGDFSNGSLHWFASNAEEAGQNAEYCVRSRQQLRCSTKPIWVTARF